jgi:hypothetical protein
MAPRKSTTTVQADAPVEKKARVKHAPVDVKPDLLVFNDEPVVAGGFGLIDSLVAALHDSYEGGKWKSFPFAALSEDFTTAERVVRNHAAHLGYGVSVRQRDDRIAFIARDRQKRSRKTETADAASV